MKYAYSILLGEYLEAKDCDYEDSKGFQLICAGTCKEPVFKVVRKTAEGHTHYFSHYKEEQANPLYVECELRVKSISKELIEETAKTSRGQRLELFMRVFQDEMWRTHFPTIEDIERARSTMFYRVVHCPPFNDFMAGYKKHVYENPFGFTEFSKAIDGYLEDWKEVGGGRFPTELSMSTQRRIVWDLYQYLLSKPARENLNFLTRFAFMWLAIRISHGTAPVPASTEDLEKNKKLHFIVSQMLLGDWQMRDFGEPEFNGMIVKFAAEVFHESVGAMLRVDWLKLLERHLAERQA